MPDNPPSAAPDGAGLLILANSRAGDSVVHADPLPEIRSRLPRAVVRELGPHDTLDDAVAEAMAGESPPSVLGVLGGDGSVSRMAHLARRHDVPLLVLPGGTFNHFARAAGLEDVGTALDAFTAGRVREVVVAELTVDDGDPITVLNAVSLGAYPQFLAERTRRSSLGKWIGGVVATWRELHGSQPIGIVHDGRRATIWSLFVSVGRNDPDRHAMMQRVHLDDATLDVRVHHARGSRVRAMASLAFGRRTVLVLRALRLMPPSSEVERFVEPEWEVAVRPGDAPPVYVHDGELEEADPAGFTLRIRAVPAALRVYAP